MTTHNKQKTIYFTPEIKPICLDNEISLVMQSSVTPPGGPGEYQFNKEVEQVNPFQINE